MNDITKPLRLATGSHQAGSGRGCAMNLISWENGDTIITDFPACSARFLASLVQGVNDSICEGHDGGGYGFLCPACSVKVLDLGHQTVGTGMYAPDQLIAWLDELVNSPDWGCKSATAKSAEEATEAAWKAAEEAAEAAAADAAWSAAEAEEAEEAAWKAAEEAAEEAAEAAEAAAWSAAKSAEEAEEAAWKAAEEAAEAAGWARYVHAQKAISAWHRICGTTPVTVEESAVVEAYDKMVRV